MRVIIRLSGDTARQHQHCTRHKTPSRRAAQLNILREILTVLSNSQCMPPAASCLALQTSLLIFAPRSSCLRWIHRNASEMSASSTGHTPASPEGAGTAALLEDAWQRTCSLRSCAAGSALLSSTAGLGCGRHAAESGMLLCAGLQPPQPIWA